MNYLKIKMFIPLIVIILLINSCQSTGDKSDEALANNPEIKTFNFIDVDGNNIHYKDSGEGKPELLFLHGFLGNLYNWDQITPALEKDYRIVSYDRLGFGFTKRPEESKDFNPYKQSAAEKRAFSLIEQMNMDRPVLVGHSAGGNLALRLAIERPDNFSALILISPAIYSKNPGGLSRMLIRSGLLDKAGLRIIRKLPERLDEIVDLTYYDASSVTEEMINNYTAPLNVDNWDTALWEYTKARGQNPVPKRLDEIELPVLFIHGRNDEIVSVKESIRASAEIRNSVLVILNECGHIAFEEKPAETAEIIKSFLEQLQESNL